MLRVREQGVPVPSGHAGGEKRAVPEIEREPTAGVPPDQNSRQVKSFRKAAVENLPRDDLGAESASDLCSALRYNHMQRDGNMV
jgi:hypothetical protein